MDQEFDLFGDPIPSGRGKPGRPQHIATVENRNKVKMLLAFGWGNDRIAQSLGITQPTLRRNYFQELKVRDAARAKLEASYKFRVLKKAMDGDSSALRLFGQIMEHELGPMMPPLQTVNDKSGKPMKLGKKQQADLEAQKTPDDWQSLLGETEDYPN